MHDGITHDSLVQRS